MLNKLRLDTQGSKHLNNTDQWFSNGFSKDKRTWIKGNFRYINKIQYMHTITHLILLFHNWIVISSKRSTGINSISLKSCVKPCYITYAWLSFKNRWWFKKLEIYVYFPFPEIVNANRFKETLPTEDQQRSWRVYIIQIDVHYTTTTT